MVKISSIVITYNEADNIAECLESLKWCDEIIVVDSNSTDKTREIAKKFAPNIIITEDKSYGQKRNIGIDKSSGEWILWLDADERITDNLRGEIINIINNQAAGVDAYLINRKSFFINRFIRHSGWSPDYTLRLFKKSSGILSNEATVHEKMIYAGKTAKLKNLILHYTDKSFEHYIKKLNNYTTLSAKQLFDNNKKASFFDIIFRPVFTFFKMYFLKLGFLDGYMGLVLCTLSSLHVLIKYSKLWFMYQKG
jgi:glycosyltransferase involved in cell wall biosynthesis